MGKEGRRGGNEKGGELESLMILFLSILFNIFNIFRLLSFSSPFLFISLPLLFPFYSFLNSFSKHPHDPKDGRICLCKK